jgi:hypothetical protein
MSWRRKGTSIPTEIEARWTTRETVVTPPAILTALRAQGHSPRLVGDRFDPGYCRPPKDAAKAEALIAQNHAALVELLRLEHEATRDKLHTLPEKWRHYVSDIAQAVGARVKEIR